MNRVRTVAQSAETQDCESILKHRLNPVISEVEKDGAEYEYPTKTVTKIIGHECGANIVCTVVCSVAQ